MKKYICTMLISSLIFSQVTSYRKTILLENEIIQYRNESIKNDEEIVRMIKMIREILEGNMKKSDLDKRICDVEEVATNTQTYREFIDECCQEFYGEKFDLDSMSEESLNKLLDFMDYLCDK